MGDSTQLSFFQAFSLYKPPWENSSQQKGNKRHEETQVNHGELSPNSLPCKPAQWLHIKETPDFLEGHWNS
jgi:hypothetical protein